MPRIVEVVGGHLQLNNRTLMSLLNYWYLGSCDEIHTSTLTRMMNLYSTAFRGSERSHIQVSM